MNQNLDNIWYKFSWACYVRYDNVDTLARNDSRWWNSVRILNHNVGDALSNFIVPKKKTAATSRQAKRVNLEINRTIRLFYMDSHSIGSNGQFLYRSQTLNRRVKVDGIVHIVTKAWKEMLFKDFLINPEQILSRDVNHNMLIKIEEIITLSKPVRETTKIICMKENWK